MKAKEMNQGWGSKVVGGCRLSKLKQGKLEIESRKNEGEDKRS